MKKTITLLALIILVSCSKKEEKSEPNSNTVEINEEKATSENSQLDKQKVMNFLASLEDKSQFFTVSSSKANTVKGKKGTIIHIDPKNLELENGESLGKNLKIELKELTNQNDFFKNNAQTVSNGKLLISGGSYYIDITSDGNKVQLKKEKTLAVNFPKITNTKMDLFYGKRNELNQMNWDATNKAFTNEVPKTDTKTKESDLAPDIEAIDFDDLLAYTEKGEDNISKKDRKQLSQIDSKIYKVMQLNKLGWINCDEFYNRATESFVINYENKDELTFVKSYILFKNINSVMDLFTDSNTKLSNAIHLPINQKIKIVSFSFKNDKFYFGEKEVTLIKDKLIEITFKEVSEQELNKLIKTI